MRSQTIAITATFTAEPVEESLSFWMQELGISSRVEFAPYSQVFQQLLDPASLLSANGRGVNVVLVRFEDWGKLGEADDPAGADGKIERNVKDFLTALKSAAGRSAAVPYLVVVCPASRAALADAPLATLCQRMEALMASELETVGGVYLVTTAAWKSDYPAATYDDPRADKLGHVPYTEDFFAALGTVIARKIYRIESAPHKVIALDCDQTLWKGVCGEDGPQGIEIDPARKALQEFMVEQHRGGMLICLCSKNNEEDVVKVFDERPEMPLTRDHIVAWRINWAPKSENLKALAEELQLGLDSFIFVDDDWVACAEVQANCPEVLTLQLPSEPSQIPRFLNHVWAFDQLKVTNEDERRTALYKQNAERERFRQESLSFGGFLESLALKIQISELQPHHLARVSQLTQRTNQFNFTTVRRSEGDIQTLWRAGQSECLVTEVSDRFGDYGLVGVTIFEAGGEALEVDTFLLSCRALGRGVEHRMLARLGEIAKERGLDRVDVRYINSGKNQPALDFLENVGADFKKVIDGGYSYGFPVEFAAELRYNPESTGPAASHSSFDKPSTPTLSDSHYDSERPAKSALLRRIATELSSAEEVLRVLESRRQRARPESAEAYAAPRTPVEEKLAAMWTQTLGLDRVGVHDNFFQLGGHSLLGTLLISRVSDAFHTNLSLRHLFESPTVAELAHVIKRGQIEQASEGEIAAALKELDGLSDEEVMALLASEEDEVKTDR